MKLQRRRLIYSYGVFVSKLLACCDFLEMDWEFRRSRKRDVSEDSAEERRSHRINFNDRVNLLYTLLSRNRFFPSQRGFYLVQAKSVFYMSKSEYCNRQIAYT